MPQAEREFQTWALSFPVLELFYFLIWRIFISCFGARSSGFPDRLERGIWLWYYRVDIIVSRGDLVVKYFRQFVIIMFVTCIGEVLHYLLPLPIPASIYGLAVMLVLLMTRAVKLENVGRTADLLVELMPLMFIPAGVGLVASWTDLKCILVPVLVITPAVTVIVMIVTGKTSDWLLSRTESGRETAEVPDGKADDDE